MANDQPERGERVKLGRVKQLTTKAGNAWFVGNMGTTTKIVLLPERRQNDAGEWETVDGSFEVFLQAKTADEIKKDREYWESRRGNASDRGSSSSSSSSGGDVRLKKHGAPAGSGKGNAGAPRNKDGDIDDQIPF